MKTEQIMEVLFNSFTEDEKQWVKNNIYISDSKNSLTNLYLDLKEDLRKEVNKSKDPTKSKIVDYMMKYNEKNKTHLLGYSKYNDFYYFIDGYRIFKSNDTFGYNELEKAFDINNLYNLNYDVNIKVDIKDVKLFIKLNKITRSKVVESIPYILESDNFKIGFNPIYLLDALQYSDTDTLYIDAPTTPAYTKDKEGNMECLVLPIRLKN